jgi:hypothetical protein
MNMLYIEVPLCMYLYTVTAWITLLWSSSKLKLSNAHFFLN